MYFDGFPPMNKELPEAKVSLFLESYKVKSVLFTSHVS
jgi:hypothetical protein